MKVILEFGKEPEDESTMKRFQEELKNVEFSFDENASNEAEKAEKRVQRELHPRSPRVFPPPFINLPFVGAGNTDDLKYMKAAGDW